jgi:hypothetical protein
MFSYHVGKEESPLVAPPYRVYFVWKDVTEIVKARDYSEEQLAEHLNLGRFSAAELDVAREALAELRRFNRIKQEPGS